MEVWLEEKKPEVMSTTNVVLALVLHALFFAAVFTFAKFHFKPKETVIPIDLTLVVNENLDGVDNEPPPVNDPPPPEPTPPKPPEPTPPTPPPPPPPVETKVDAVVKEPEKKKPEEKKPEPPKETLEERIKRMRESVKAPEKKKETPKKVEEKKPEPPKKTKEELLKERMDQMVKNAKPVKIKVPDAPSGNGITDRKPPMTDKQIQDYLNKGYKPGSTTQIASSQMQYCISRIQQAIDARWREVMPRIGAEGTVVILARVNAQGRLVNCRLKDSCGDRTSDAAAMTVVKTVPAIAGLDREFLKKYAKEDLAIRYKVKAR